MHTTFVACFLAFSAAATAAPLVKRETTLSPWKVTELAVFTPSGRPGSYPWSTITANVTDPNALILGTSPDGTQVSLPAGGLAVNCQAKWLIGTSPTNHVWPCNASGEGDGYWAMEIVENGGWSTTNFDLKITRVADTLYGGSQYKKAFVATGYFQVGENLSGTCGGSGVCSWGLKQGSNPVPIQPAESRM